MLKRIICGTALMCIMFMMLSHKSYAHDKDGHNTDLEEVLFGEFTSLSSHAESAIEALEDAAYLTIDQFNGNGEPELKYLRERYLNVSWLPKDIYEIDFKSNTQHRSFTHRGWEYYYINDKAHWNRRKKILLNTCRKELSKSDCIEEGRSYEDICDSFSALVYYVHIIGDHNEDKSYKKTSLKMELGGRKDDESIIAEIQKHEKILFADQVLSLKYIVFNRKLSSLNKKISKLVNSDGGVDSTEKFEKYHQYGEELMGLLKEYIPDLLQRESYFSDAFL